MKNALIVIDMQNDFVTGSLANAQAQEIVAPLAEKIASFDGLVIATRDTHREDYLSSPEGKYLPVEHCIEDTNGWELVDEIREALMKKQEVRILNKPTFGLTSGWELSDYDSVELVGVCTDICVISNALILKALYPALTVKVIGRLCAGLSPEKHNAALEVMKSCQVEVIE